MTDQLGLFPDLDPPAAGGSGADPGRTERALGRGARGADRVRSARVPADVAQLASALPRGLRLGTSSWSFPGWSGIVYDGPSSESSLARHGLAAYARHPLLRTVGLDRTYYRPIPAEVFREYAAAVPPDFRMLVKADRRVTSPADPDARGGRTPNPDFLDPAYAAREVITPAVEGLGAALGPIVFQFSPLPTDALGGPRAFAARLSRFLGALPGGPRYAVEIRTSAWLTPAYADALDRHGVAHTFAVHPTMPSVERQAALLAPHSQPVLVVRWMLGGGLRYDDAKARYEPFDRLVDEDPSTRGAIAVAALDALIAEREAFVVANNKAEGSAPLTLLRLAERIAEWAPPARPSRPDEPGPDEPGPEDARHA